MHGSMSQTLKEMLRKLFRTAETIEKKQGWITFLEYGLSNQEGVALMCLAESLLRIPDNQTCDEIIEEKIGGKKWLEHLNSSPSILLMQQLLDCF